MEKPANPLKYLRGFLTELENKSGKGAVANDDDDEEEAPRAARPSQGNRRGGVSADVIDNDDAIDYVKKVLACVFRPCCMPTGCVFQVIPKDAATMISLQRCVAGNVLFVHLEPEELTDVLDAMFQVKKSAGDVIMKQGK